MTAFGSFHPRRIMALPLGVADGWRLKRYALVADGRTVPDGVAEAAFDAAIAQLPRAATLENDAPYGNHGIGFQIVHFAEAAVISPVFYWVWESVLAKLPQLRAEWSAPAVFGNGAEVALGCVWEMQIVTHETQAWVETMLSGRPARQESARYLDATAPGAVALEGEI